MMKQTPKQKNTKIDMNPADKFEVFLRVCKWVFWVLLGLNLTGIIDINYWIVFSPVIIALIMIVYAFNN